MTANAGEGLLGASLAALDPEIAALATAEADRQAATLDLIAAESASPAAVHEAMAAAFADKTAEGYPGRRYHRGTQVVDIVETLAVDRAKALFGAEHANVQAHSGAGANLAVYQAVLAPGDRVLAMRLADGGHLSHGDQASITGRIYRFSHYGLDPTTERIDLDQVRDIARRDRPALIVAGGSAYPRAIDYAVLGEIAREVGALLLVDMAHVAGLVAAGRIPSPVPHADLVTFTTYKTLLGPHGGVILSRAALARKVDRAIFPGTQGAPDFGRIAGKAVCFRVAATPWFGEVQARIVRTAGVLATGLAASGDRIVTGGTDTHLVLVDLRPRGLTGDVAERALESVGILANRNLIPSDPAGPETTSGIRLGTTVLAERGMDEPAMDELAGLIDAALRDPDDDARARIAAGVGALAARYPLRGRTR